MGDIVLVFLDGIALLMHDRFGPCLRVYCGTPTGRYVPDARFEVTT